MSSLRDVARVAGVSLATASRAFAQPERVAPERRARVERAAAELGYRPGRRSLQPHGPAGPGRSIGLLVPDLQNPFFAGVAKGVQLQARTAGLSVVIADTDEDPRVEAETLARMDQQVAGLVLCSPRMSDQALAALPIDVPAVLVNRESEHLRAVLVDNRDGVRQALAHLHALGHRRIAYAGGHLGSWSDRERSQGLEAAAQTLAGTELIHLGQFPTVFGGGVAAADLVPASGATAVIAHNDLIALGILDRLRQRGTLVPERVSVVGFDDIPAATQVTPTLTTVAVPLQRLGRAAVELLLDDDTDGENVTMAVSLVVRGSTGPLSPVAPVVQAGR
jgi:DNA-binding LacI/PurR family transcriptional regulator